MLPAFLVLGSSRSMSCCHQRSSSGLQSLSSPKTVAREGEGGRPVDAYVHETDVGLDDFEVLSEFRFGSTHCLCRRLLCFTVVAREQIIQLV